MWADGLRNTHMQPEGEVGILDNVRQSIVRPDSSLFLTMKHMEVSNSVVSLSTTKNFAISCLNC
jgi:hypothetical protein